tara:strand:+ start:3376 stop:3816 length:441 start_codon:yes stop_codon:yes gene_type:complete
MSEELLETVSGLPDYEPETIEEVATAEEAVKTFDDLWRNLVFQHRTKYQRYTDMNASLSSMSFDDQETRVDFTELNSLRDEIVKIEGGLETLNLYRVLVLKVEAEPWIQEEIEEKRKIKVRTRPGYEKYAEWESDNAGADALNKAK